MLLLQHLNAYIRSLDMKAIVKGMNALFSQSLKKLKLFFSRYPIDHKRERYDTYSRPYHRERDHRERDRELGSKRRFVTYYFCILNYSQAYNLISFFQSKLSTSDELWRTLHES